MAQLAVSFLMVLGTVLSVNAVSPYSYNSNPYATGQVASGALGTDYSKVTAAQEDHNKKNFGINYSSDQGSSSSLNKVNAQLGASAAVAQGTYPYQYGYPSYPSYPQYPPVGGGWTPQQPVSGGWTPQVPPPQQPVGGGWTPQVPPPQQPVGGGWTPQVPPPQQPVGSGWGRY